MKIKISEDFISEFIGIDLEPIEGSIAEKKGEQTFVNLPNDRGDAPPTGTKLNRQASKEKDLLAKYLWGGNRKLLFTSESKQMGEDVVAKDRLESEVIPNTDADISDVSILFGEEVLEQNIKDLIELLTGVAKRKDDEQMKGLNYVILSYLIDNINTSSLSREQKRKLINGIK